PGSIESGEMPEFRDLRTREVLRYQEVGRISGQEQQRERDKTDPNEHRQAVEKTAGHVGRHVLCLTQRRSKAEEQIAPLRGPARVKEQDLPVDRRCQVLQVPAPQVPQGAEDLSCADLVADVDRPREEAILRSKNK